MRQKIPPQYFGHFRAISFKKKLLRQPNARVKHRIQHIDQNIHHHKNQGRKQHATQDNGNIKIQQSRHRCLPEAIVRKNAFDKKSPRQKTRKPTRNRRRNGI